MSSDPGVQVAQLSSSKRAVSIRGFDDLFSNKLLVLIDGRSVYNRTFSGVLWELQDVIASDIERVEVIRGPGGVAWGANAVNGVINVITRPAAETQGLDVNASVGTFARARTGLRYGGTVGETAYRLFSQWSEHADSKPGPGLQLSDNWRSLTSGARADWSCGATAVMAQGHVTTNRTRPGWLAPMSSPSTADRDLRVNVGVLPGETLPIVVGLSGNPDYQSEGFLQFEAGYRVRLGTTASVDTTIFAGAYDGLPTTEPIEPIVELTPEPAHILAGGAFENLMSARMSGVEVNARWNPVPQWRLETSYAFLHLTGKVDAASLDPIAADPDGNSPTHQWDARTAYSLRRGIEVSASLWRVGRLRDLLVPAYTRLDAKTEFRVSRQLTAAVVVQNILQGDHQEFASDSIVLASRLPRSARLDLRWAF